MPNPNDNRKWLYDKLTEKGVKMGTYEQFDKAIDDENNLKWVYDKASSQGLKVGDYNQFSGALKRVAAEAPATAEKPVAETVQTAETDAQAAPEAPATEKVEEEPATKPAVPPKKPTLTDSYKVPEINTPFTQPERPDVPVPFAPETTVNSTEVKNTDEKAAAELREQTERDVQRYGTGNADYTFEEAVSVGKEYEKIAPEIAKYDERLKAFKDKYGPMEEIVKQVNEGKRKLTQEEYRKLQAQYPGYDKEAKALSELGKSYDAILATAPGREYKAVSKRMDEIGKGPKTPEAVLEYAQEFSKLQRNPLYRAQLGEDAPSEDEIQSDWLQAQAAYLESKLEELRDSASGPNAAMLAGNAGKNESRRKQERELKKQISEVKEALYANPYYRKHIEGKIAENKAQSENISAIRAEYAEKLKAGQSEEGYDANAKLYSSEIGLLDAAAAMREDAIREYETPTKYDETNGWVNAAKGLGSWVSDDDTWTFGLKSFINDIGAVRPVLEKVEKIAGNVNRDEIITNGKLDELESQLTPGELAVLDAYFEKVGAVAMKGADTSIGYQIGQGIGDMVNLGIEMALTGGVGTAVREGVDKVGMAMMKKLMEKRLYRQFAKSGVGRVALWTGHKAVRDVAETLVRIPFMPSTYKAIGEGAVELSSDYKTRDFMEYAPEKAFDNFVEQLTEVSNGFAFPLIGKVMKMRGMKNFVTSVIGKDSAKALRTFIERGDIKLLDDMMIGSFGGEWEEELLGAVIHSVTDDPNALRDFFSAEQQLVLLGTLAPIPLARGTAGGVQLAVPAAQAALAWNKAESELKRLGFDEGRIARLKEVVDNASAPEGARAIMQAMKDAGFSRSTAEGQGFLDATGSPENDVLYGSVPEIDRDAYDALAHYYWRAQQKRAAGLMGEVEQDRKVRDKRAELKSKYGQFWHNEMGEEVVETGTIIGADGNPLNVFIASDEPMEDGRVAYVGEDGSNGFLSRDQLVGQNADGTFAPNPETTVTPINIYLAGLVMQDSQVQEAQGVVNEASAANTSLRDQIEGLADVKYKGQSGTITRADDEGAVFVPDEGENVRVTWADLAAENGIQVPMVETPSERTGDAAALVAEHTRLKQELAGAFRQASNEAGKNGRGALLETDEGTATVVNIISDTIDPENGTAQFTVRMPDGSMNVTMATAIEPVMSQLRGESAPEPEPEPAPAPAPAPGPQPPAGGAGGAEVDFRGNTIPMKDGQVDEEAFREKDPEAWAAWNDALPEDDPRKATLGTKKRLEGLAKSSKSAADKAQKDLEKLYDKGATDKEIREKETEIRDQRARQKRYEDAIASIDKRALDKAQEEREAARKAAEAERLRREKEKEEEEKRKAGKAPDISEDTPEAAQKRGYIMVNGNRIDRPTPDAVAEKGKDTKIAFTKSVAVDGKYGLVEATRIEPSHVSDQENPLHFFAKKWQPKNRKRADSAVAIQQMANGIRPGEITRGETAYGGAPIVNERGEVIQGNGRSEALRRAYGQGTAAEYKAWLADHAEEFGLTREQVEKMETPILVRVLDVDDARAEQLGKMEQKDLESGGDQRFNGKTLVKKMGKRFGEFLDYLFAGDLGDDATALDYINQNGYTALHWLHQNGFINDTEYANAQDNGKLTEETVSAFRAMSIEPLFDNVPEKVRSGFEMLPNSVKLALQRSVATLYGLEGVIGDIQDALAYYCDFETADPAFKKAKNTTEAWDAVTAWMQNVRFDGTSEGEAHPSIVARRLASIFKGGVLVEGEKNPKRTEKAYRSLFANIASTMRGEGGFMSAAEPTDNIGAYRENNVITEEEENQIRNGKNDNRPGPASGSGANVPVGGQGSGPVREGRPGGVPERKPAGEGAGPVAPKAPAAPAPEPSAPKTGYGANNTLVTNEDYEELKKQWAELMGEAGTLGIVPKTMTLKQQMKLVSLGAQMAAYHIEAGVRKFVDLSKRLLQDVGESIRPYLKALYKAARELPGIGEYVRDMNTDAEVDAIDVNAIGKEEEPAEDSNESIEKEMMSTLHGLTERIMSQMGSSTIQQEIIIDRRNDLGFVAARSLFYFRGGGVTTRIVYDFKDGKHENGRIEITRIDNDQFNGIQRIERTFALDTPFEEIASAVKTMGEEQPAEPAEEPKQAEPKYNEGDTVTFWNPERTMRITGKIVGVKVTKDFGTLYDVESVLRTENPPGRKEPFNYVPHTYEGVMEGYIVAREKAAEPAPAPEKKPTEAQKPTTKDGWLKKMGDVYKELCNKFKVPEDPLVQTGMKRYNFDYSATKGYTLDALEKYYEEYRKKLEDAVEPATEKQLAYIDRLADEQDKEILKGVTLNKVSAGYVISILKAAEDAIGSKMSTVQEFEEYENELRRVAELNGKTENKPENTSESPEKSVTSQEENLEQGSLFGEPEPAPEEKTPVKVAVKKEQGNGLQGNDGAVLPEGLPTDNRGPEGQPGEGSQRAGEGEGSEAGGTDGRGQRDRAGDVRPDQPRPDDSVKKNTRNNRVSRGETVYPKNPAARYRANLAAIRLLKQIEQEGREATKEEMEVLRKFTGWGGLGAFFNNRRSLEYREISEVLTTDEIQAAENSINTAYYTPVEVIDAMWDIAKKLGFKGGRVLEGSAGIGNILASMPEAISNRSDIQAVELDPITGGILRLLYPDASVLIDGFENADIPNNSVDLAITNVPFGDDIRVYDEKEKDLTRKFGGRIHDFCIAKNIRKLKEGGIAIFITSRSTLDSASKTLRNWIVNEGGADVIGVFRLNNDTFEGTGATSDIIVVRKRVNGEVSPDAINIQDTSIVRRETYETTDRNNETTEAKAAMEINDYFAEHPENMGGEMAFGFEKGDSYRPGSSALWPADGVSQSERLEKWVSGFRQQVQIAKRETAEEPEQANAKKEGQLVLNSKGKLCISRRGQAVPLDVNDSKVAGYTKAQVVKDYDAIKTALDAVLRYQLDNATDEGLSPLLRKLNSAYDTFVSRYGYLNKNRSITFLRNDVDFPSIAALESYREKKDITGKVTVSVSKAPVFSGRVLGQKTTPTPKDVRDGVIVSMTQFGRIDIPFIAKALGRDEESVRKEALKSGLCFENPENGTVEVEYEYLSGNVREKLAYAESHNEDGKYDANIKALKEVIPRDIPAHLIEFSLGSDWLPVSLYTEYAKEKFGVNNDFIPQHFGGSWGVANENYGQRNDKNISGGVRSEKLGGLTKTGVDLMLAAMNKQTVKFSVTYKDTDGTKHTETDKEASQAAATKIDEMRDDFKEWCRKRMLNDKELSESIAKTYNDTFNAIAPKRISEIFSPEHFEGQVETMGGKPFHLYPHQSQAVVRATTQPLMMAHEVGTGKTFTLITTAMEMRRLGTAKKPMIVVQNATLGQFVSSAKALYPNAKILTISEKDRTREGRSEFYAKIKYNDWDMIIVPQSVFEMIPDSEKRKRDYIEAKIDEARHILAQATEAKNAAAKKRLEEEIKDLEYERDFGEKRPKKNSERDAKREAKVKNNAKARAQQQLDRKTDEVSDFDDMGIDALLVDEAHNYKRLGFSTSMAQGVKGVDPAYSKKSAGVYLKTRAVFDKAGWKNVVFATGTPISNTAAEIWTFMRYMMPDEMMRELHIYYFDDFVSNFGNISQSLEFTTSGKFKENSRFASYTNLPELIRIWSSVTDTVLTKDAVAAKADAGEEAEKLDDKVPVMESWTDDKGEVHENQARDIYLPQSPSLVRIMNAVRARLEWYESLTGKEKRQNSSVPLVMYGLAKMAAIDPRLVDRNAADEPQSKTNKAVEETLRALKDSERYKGTCALFSDNFRRVERTADGKTVEAFNLFEEIKRKLVAAGVPEDQIVIIKNGMSVQAKEKIFAAVNAGDIRVIMGTTASLGTGVNIQERLFFEAHLDAPNRPMDYTQRMGRILRQGNLHKQWGIPVRVVRFGVEDSLDVTAYQRLSTKSKFINSIMDGRPLIENGMENRILEEEEEGVFDNPVAVLSGSQYAMLKSAAERELRKLRGKKEQHRQDQIYIESNLKYNEGAIKNIKDRIKESEKWLSVINEKFPDGKIDEIVIEGKKVSTAEEIAAALKEKIFDPLKAAAEQRKKYAEEGNWLERTREESKEFSIKVNGVLVHVYAFITPEEDWRTRKISISTTVRYEATELGIDGFSTRRMPNGINGVKEIINDFRDNVASGKLQRENIESYNDRIARLEADNESMMARRGKPFADEAKLAEQEKLVENLTQKMKDEMAEKEAKYASQAAGIDGSTFDLDAASESTEEEDSEEGDLYRTSDEIAEEYPNWMDDQTSTEVEGSQRGQNTQVAGTVGTYKKVGDWIESNLGKDTKVLDASSGLGLGTLELRERGFDVEDIEPYPGRGRKEQPTYGGEDAYQQAVDDGKEYDFIISNAVLNVIPDDWRAGVLHNMARLLKPGGRMFINTRKAGEERTIKNKIELDSPQEVLVGTPERINSYQRFFTPAELKEYVERELGDGYTVEIANKRNSGTSGLAAVVVTKKTEGERNRRGENLRNPIDRAAAIVKINEIANKLGVKFEEDPDLKAKGVFSPKTGKIRINIDAHKNTADLEATLLHEAVAHYGLRKLFGKDWKELRMRLYEQASPEIKARVDAIAKADGLSTEVAMEEYIAQLAEDGRFDEQEESFWQKIVTALKRLLAKIGINSGYLTDEDFRAMLYASYRNLQTGGALETAARVATAAALRRNAEASHEDNGPEDDGPGGGLPADTEEDMMGRGNDEVVREVSADLYDRYENQNGEDKPWMSENELIDRIEEELTYGIDTKELFAKIDEYRRLDEEDFNEGRRDFSGSERDNVFREIMAELERLSKERPVRLAVSDSSVSREKNEIKAMAQANGSFMKAPNGQPTNLTEDQWLTVRTKAFKDWFGDWENDPANASKVVDENGEPRVMYHGTKEVFNTFKTGTKGTRFAMGIPYEVESQGFFFTASADNAGEYGRQQSKGDGRSRIVSAFLNMRNPADLSTLTSESEKLFKAIVGQYPAEYNPLEHEITDWWQIADKQGDEYDIDLQTKLQELGYDGIIFAEKDGNKSYFVLSSNQIKSATQNNGNFSSEDEDIYHNDAFAPPFFSNAHAALGRIKMDKATPEQWVKMLEKEGGLKAGEDKWIGLSDWLKSQDKKTITKQEIEDYIAQNQIRIEEDEYTEEGDEYAVERRHPGFNHAFFVDQNVHGDPYIDGVNNLETAVELYNRENEDKIEINGVEISEADYDKLLDYGDEILKDFRRINSTRLKYTTEGLADKREIALWVPSIEPWNENDNVHFGDAGNGRAIAWVRFGEAKDEDGRRVLFIDEIQSKRHQEGRVQGYKDDSVEAAYEEAGREQDEFIDQLMQKYGVDEDGLESVVSPEEFEKARELDEKVKKIRKQRGKIPAAPFEKNWHELAMKRMLRLAAEEGYDYVAWTTGNQQADRYNIGNYVSSIDRTEADEGERAFGLYLGDADDSLEVVTDENGNVIRAEGHLSQAVGKPLSELVGKEVAVKMMKMDEYDVLEDVDLKIGGEGMRGFYDDILPRFMNKYGKKWGVSTKDDLVSLSDGTHLEAHMVPVTSEMAESVLQGQAMFRKADLSELPENEREQAEDMEIDQDTEEYYRRDRGYSEAKTADDMYDRRTSTVGSALYTAQVDEYAPLDAFQESISAEAKKELSENERVSNRLRELGGQAMNEVRSYNEKFLQPMWKAIAELRKAVRGADGGKLSMQELTRYVGLKSGLERNELFAKRDAKKDAKSYYDKEYDNRKAELTTRENEEKARLKARLDEGIISDVTYQGELNALAIRIQQLKDKADADHQANIDNVDKETASEYRRLYGEYRQKDYSGLLSWFTEEADLKRSDYPSRKAYRRAVNAARKNYVAGVTDLASAEDMAKRMVDDIESRAGSQIIGNLWNRINAATKETLDFQYRKNMISRQQRADISASMKFYIPMRGFEDATAEDLYSYYMKPNVSGFAPTILAAQGRHTRYRSPFGMIGFMHSSAVSQGLKNEAKLELLDFVRRNPKNTVATVTRAWFVKTGDTDADGKPIYEVAYPQVPEGATIDEREHIIEDFETDMKERKEKGEAYNAHREVQMNGGVVAFEKDAHRTEHIVRVMEGGREYGIVINGNPAAAQAVNGIKRQGGYENFLEIMRATRRVLSQMFTTLSVPFWVSNFQRDHGQGGINTFVRNNLGYVGKYIINRWELLPQMIPLVLSRAEQGSFIDRLSPKFADYYRLYIENGGPMGQNRIETDVTFNRQLERYLRTQQNDKAYIKKGARALGDLLSAIGEGVETITRFATFVTSMEYGRPLHEAIADSKEVSTNFARKGHGRSISWEETGRMETRSGRQLGDTSGSTLETYRNYVDRALIVSSSAVLELLRAGIPFFNAAIQGIKNKTDNYRKNWVKALLADGTYFAIGFAMRYFMGGAGGDDDKEKYGHTSDYTRRNNFLTPLGEGKYHKWALSQEYRYMYALGDITAEALLQEKPYDDLALDAFEALVQVLPAGAVDPSARGEAFWIDAIKSVMPGVVTPIVEAFENKDFKGSRIYDEGFNGNKTDYPGWTKAIDTTGPGYVKAAEWLNQVSGGGEENATVRGSIDFNPAIVEHFVKSYLSGPYQIVGGVGAIVGKKMRGEEIASRDIPVWNRVFMNTNDNSRDAYYSGLYYYFKDLDKEARRLDTGMRGHQTQQAKDFRKSKDYAYMLIFKKYESNERALNQMKKAAQNAGNDDAAKNVELKTTDIRERIAKECLDVYFDRVDWKSWLEKTNSGNEN